jgi:hypothetical protein
VSGGELVLGHELAVNLVAAANELDVGDLFAREPAAGRLESDQLGGEPALVRLSGDLGVERGRVLGDLGVRRQRLGVDPRLELGGAAVAVDQIRL